METIISFFNLLFEFIPKIIDGFVEFFNTIPVMFNKLTPLFSQILPQDFAVYFVAFIPILITLTVIRFVK